MENPHEKIILQEYRKSLKRLHSTWDEIGFDHENRDKRTAHISEQVQLLLADMVKKENKLKEEIMVNIEKYGEQFYRLNKDLGSQIEDPDEDLSLLDLDEFLRTNVEVLMKEVKERQSNLKTLLKKEQELCERLIEEPTEVPKRQVPSLEDIDFLERKIRTLEQEKINRENTFHHLQHRLSNLLEELEQKINTSFERDTLSDVELFTLSQQNLQKMKDIKDDYEFKVKQNEAESHNLRDQIERLWNRLEVEESTRQDFLSYTTGHAPSTLVKLRDELEYLKDRQKDNLQKFVNKLRREIDDWWEKCYIGKDEMEQFTPYFSDDYSEEVLQAHDQEVARLSKFYKDNLHIFTKIKQRKELWLKFIQLEAAANDPNRFGNRGGSLLREEKERKFVKKQLPGVEKDLEDLVHRWEAEHGKTFYIQGLTVTEYLENEWLLHHNKKEMEKQKKQSERISQLNHESRMGSKPPVKRRMAANETHRKSKLQRVSEDIPFGLPSTTNMKNNSRMVLRERNPNSIREGSEHSSAEVSSYSRFSESIQLRSEREYMRSSAVNGSKKFSMGRPSPYKPPMGLPKTPKTVPRPPSRYSPRLSGSRSARRSSRPMTSSHITFSPSSLGKSRNISTRLNFSPSASPLFRSPRGSPSKSGTPSKWNKRTFLM